MDEHIVITENNEVLIFDQEPWEEIEPGVWWFKAKSIEIEYHGDYLLRQI